MDNRRVTMKIADVIAHRQWEQLLGCRLYSDHVDMTPTFYERNAQAIGAIQMGSALRRAAMREKLR